MSADPDAGDGPDQAWWRAEVDGCRAEIERLRAENAAMRPVVEAADRWYDDEEDCRPSLERTVEAHRAWKAEHP